MNCSAVRRSRAASTGHRTRWRPLVPRAAAANAACAAGAERRPGYSRARAMPGGGERMAQRADHQAAHVPRVAEAHLGLGGMDVDVDQRRVEIEEQHGHRMAVARQEILVGGADHADHQPVLHRPAVDEQILVLRRPRLNVGRPAKPETRTPSRSASISTAFSRNSRPSTAPSRLRRAASGRPSSDPASSEDLAAGRSTRVRRRRLRVDAAAGDAV